ncbi:MAG: ABC-2 family transporter protein [Deltaproteobacteria bacterium]|nr:ABC-2 family transporter protein [Deltaproteobacteria bacterium]
MSRTLAILGVQLRRSVLVALQYRVDFVLNAVMAVFWTASSIVPLFVLYSNRKSVAGWTWPEALVVVACFTMLKGCLSGAIQPSLQAVVEQVRKGTLDFLLLKPADAQLLVSTSRFELWRTSDVVSGALVLVYALVQLGYTPSVGAVALMALLLVSAVAILYAIFIVVISLAFRFVKVDNLSYLFMSIYDAARWPASVFRGVFSFVFTFVIPLALMTTYPALALLGRLAVTDVLIALATAAAFFLAARVVWLRSIRHYTSAGG